MEIFLIRHGEKEAWPIDPALTPKGREQVEITARKLLDLFPKQKPLILNSPSRRCQETAQLLAASFQVPCYSCHLLAINYQLPSQLSAQKSRQFFHQLLLQEWQKNQKTRGSEEQQLFFLVTHHQNIQQFLTEFTADWPLEKRPQLDSIPEASYWRLAF